MMTGEQMQEVTLYAVALSKMKAAADAGESATLTAGECAATVSITRLMNTRVASTEVKP